MVRVKSAARFLVGMMTETVRFSGESPFEFFSPDEPGKFDWLMEGTALLEGQSIL